MTCRREVYATTWHAMMEAALGKRGLPLSFTLTLASDRGWRFGRGNPSIEPLPLQEAIQEAAFGDPGNVYLYREGCP